MLNPNVDAIALYPPEITALLEGRALGNFTWDEIPASVQVRVGPPSLSTASLHIIYATCSRGRLR